MTWLLKLYPPRWRRRYGEELTEVIAGQPFSLGAAVDLIAGALDAWFHPHLVLAGRDVKGEASMFLRMMQLTCAGYGPDVTPRDRIMSNAVNIGGTLVLTLFWMWTLWRFGKNDYVLSLLPMAYLLPYLVSLHYTSLKGRSGPAQTVFIIGLGAGLTGFLLVVTWIAAKI